MWTQFTTTSFRVSHQPFFSNLDWPVIVTTSQCCLSPLSIKLVAFLLETIALHAQVNHASQDLSWSLNGLPFCFPGVVFRHDCRGLSFDMPGSPDRTVCLSHPARKPLRTHCFQYSSIPPVEYLLSVTPVSVNISPRAVATAYLGANGSTIADCGAAAPFLVSNGQLSSNGQFFSTTGLVPYSPLAASSYIAAISTTFSITSGSTLTWKNTAFASGHALFCVVDNTVEAVYNG